MAREREPRALEAVFRPIILSDTLPSFDAFLALGRELNEVRLYSFIDESLAGKQLAVSFARGLLSAVTRQHDAGLDAATHERADDAGHARRLLAQIEQGSHWLHVRDELAKFARLVYEELERRVAPQSAKANAAEPSNDLNRTERAALSILKAQPKGKGISAKGILKALKGQSIRLAESTLRRHILPKLAKTHGVVNHRASGGYLIP